MTFSYAFNGSTRYILYFSLKLNTNVYMKNPNPEYFKNGAIKKQSEYIQIDVKQILKQLQPGETIELKQAYIGEK